MNTELHFSTGKDDWQTPPDLFNKYNEKYHFILDAAADSHNHKCDTWFGPESPVGVFDALDADWQPWLSKGNIWLNPPYSRGLQARFVQKAAYEAMLATTGCVVCLLPVRTDTRLFHTYIWNKPNATVEFLRGRVKFVGAAAGAPFPSMIVVFQ